MLNRSRGCQFVWAVGESKKRRKEVKSLELLVGYREFVKGKQLVFFVKVHPWEEPCELKERLVLRETSDESREGEK